MSFFVRNFSRQYSMKVLRNLYKNRTRIPVNKTKVSSFSKNQDPNDLSKLTSKHDITDNDDKKFKKKIQRIDPKIHIKQAGLTAVSYAVLSSLLAILLVYQSFYFFRSFKSRKMVVDEDLNTSNLEEKEEVFERDENINDFEKMKKKYLLGHFDLPADTLRKMFPPDLKLFHRKKKVLISILDENKVEYKGRIEFSRYKKMKLPKLFSSQKTPQIFIEEGMFTYESFHNKINQKEEQVKEWYLNFADEHLFGFYDTSLFAQDEIQCAEMPILTSVRDYLQSSLCNGLFPLTTEKKSPTPCLIKNVQRHLNIDTSINLKEGRPIGLYGNNFKLNSNKMIRRATEFLKESKMQNILAMEAPKYGFGKYNKDEIISILEIAYTGFIATRIESENKHTIIHTGNWGCGAYAGNHILMSLCQIGAAKMAGIETFVFHSRDVGTFKVALNFFNSFMEENQNEIITVKKFVNFIHSKKLRWRVSDGN